jgi:hypothetical protein
VGNSVAEESIETIMRRNTGAVYLTDVIEPIYEMRSLCELFWKIPESRI